MSDLRSEASLEELLNPTFKRSDLASAYNFCAEKSWVLMGEDTHSLAVYEVNARDEAQPHLQIVFAIKPWRDQVPVYAVGFAPQCDYMYVKHGGGLDLLRLDGSSPRRQFVEVFGEQVPVAGVLNYLLNEGDQIFGESFNRDGSLLAFASLKHGKSLLQFVKTSVLDEGGFVGLKEGYFQNFNKVYDFGGAFLSQVIFSPFGPEMVLNTRDNFLFLPRYQEDEIGMDQMDQLATARPDHVSTKRPTSQLVGFVDPQTVLSFDGRFLMYRKTNNVKWLTRFEVQGAITPQLQNPKLSPNSDRIYAVGKMGTRVEIYRVNLPEKKLESIRFIPAQNKIKNFFITSSQGVMTVEEGESREQLNYYPVGE